MNRMLIFFGVGVLVWGGAGCGDNTVPPAQPGPGTLTRVDTEPAGEHCADGGAAIRTGHDLDGDGVLDDSEVEATRYVCGGGVWHGDFGRTEWADPAAVELLHAVVVIDGTLTIPEADVIELPKLEIVTQDISILGPVANLSLPSLSSVGRTIATGWDSVSRGSFDRVDLPALQTIGSCLCLGGPTPYSEINLPALRLAPDVLVGYDRNANRLSLPSLVWANQIDVHVDELELPALTRVDDRVSVQGGLLELDAPKLERIGGPLSIVSAPALTRVSMPALVWADGIEVAGVPALTMLEMPMLDTVPHDLRVTGAGALTTLDLSALRSVGGDVELNAIGGQWTLLLRTAYAPGFGSLTIRNTSKLAIDLPPLSVKGPIVFADNTVLETLRLESVYNLPQGPTVQIDNHPALRSVSITTGDTGTFTITGAPQLETLDLPTIQWANLELRDVGLRDLSGLPMLQGMNLTLSSMPDLVSLAALAQVKSIGRLEITDAPQLASLDGLDAVTEIHCALTIQNNTSLVDLSGLSHLTTLGNWLGCGAGAPAGTVVISGNRGLSLHGLEGVTDIPGDLLLSYNGFTDLSGLDHLTHVRGSLAISHSDSLASLHGLESLNGVGELHLSSDPVLTDLDSLGQLRSVGGQLQIIRLQALSHLGLTSLTYVGGCQQCADDGLEIRDTEVPADEIDALRTQIGW